MTHDANDVRLYLAISQIFVAAFNRALSYSSHFETLLGKSRRSRCSGAYLLHQYRFLSTILLMEEIVDPP
jgi:hypothetical protein